MEPNKNAKISKTFVENHSSNILHDHQKIANNFNEYFTNIVPNLANKDNDNKYILLNGFTYNPAEYFTSFERIFANEKCEKRDT